MLKNKKGKNICRPRSLRGNSKPIDFHEMVSMIQYFWIYNSFWKKKHESSEMINLNIALHRKKNLSMQIFWNLRKINIHKCCFEFFWRFMKYNITVILSIFSWNFVNINFEKTSWYVRPHTWFVLGGLKWLCIEALIAQIHCLSSLLTNAIMILVVILVWFKSRKLSFIIACQQFREIDSCES